MPLPQDDGSLGRKSGEWARVSELILPLVPMACPMRRADLLVSEAPAGEFDDSLKEKILCEFQLTGTIVVVAPEVRWISRFISVGRRQWWRRHARRQGGESVWHYFFFYFTMSLLRMPQPALDYLAAQVTCRRLLARDPRCAVPYRAKDGRFKQGVRLICANCLSNKHTVRDKGWNQKVCAMLRRDLIFQVLHVHKFRGTRLEG